MSYAPINIEVYNRAFAGMVAGILGGRPSLDAASADYLGSVTAAGAFAQEFDIVWGSVTPLSSAQCSSLQAIVTEYWRDRGVQSAVPSFYNGACLAIKAIVDEAQAFIVGNVPSADILCGTLVPGVFNVRDYGAKGDGTGDDTSAIQAAAAALQAYGGGTLLFPKGDYSVYTGADPQPVLADFVGLTGVSVIGLAGANLKIPAGKQFGGFFKALSFNACKDVVVDGLRGSGGFVDLAAGIPVGITLVDITNGTDGVSMPANWLTGAWTGLHSIQDPADAQSLHCRNINIGLLSVEGGIYGINARFSCDNMKIGLLRTNSVYRSLFCVGVQHVQATVYSSNIAGSKDVIFAAQENTDCVDCHVHYIHRDDGSGITNGNYGVVFSFTQPVAPYVTPTKNVACSAFLDVIMSGVKTLNVACIVLKQLANGSLDPVDRGYEIDGLNISGVVDLGGAAGRQALSLEPNLNWGAGEHSRGIVISNLVIKNCPVTGNPVLFNICRGLTGSMLLQNVSVDNGNAIQIYGTVASGAQNPPASTEVIVLNCVAANLQALGPNNEFPLVRQILPTGAGKTADDIITTLQAIGLVRQA